MIVWIVVRHTLAARSWTNHLYEAFFAGCAAGMFMFSTESAADVPTDVRILHATSNLRHTCDSQ